MDTRTLHIERSTSTAHRLLHYDGVCANVHGHNMNWEVSVVISMDEVGEENMALDLKDISDLVDKFDHAILLNEDDPLLDDGHDRADLGDYFTFPGDPTCETVAQWMASQLVSRFDPVIRSDVELAETDKYSIQASCTELRMNDEEEE